MGEAGLAQARRPVKQDMVDRLAPALSGGDGNLEVFLDLFLPDEVGQGTRAEAGIEGCVLCVGLSGDNAGYGLTPSEYFSKPSFRRRPESRGKGGLDPDFRRDDIIIYIMLPCLHYLWIQVQSPAHFPAVPRRQPARWLRRRQQ